MIVMGPKAFRGLLDTLMCFDYPDLDPPSSRYDKDLQKFADERARELGYDGWVHAYHEFQP